MVGATVGETVGDSEGARVGEIVGALVGEREGGTVGASVAATQKLLLSQLSLTQSRSKRQADPSAQPKQSGPVTCD